MTVTTRRICHEPASGRGAARGRAPPGTEPPRGRDAVGGSAEHARDGGRIRAQEEVSAPPPCRRSRRSRAGPQEGAQGTPPAQAADLIVGIEKSLRGDAPAP